MPALTAGNFCDTCGALLSDESPWCATCATKAEDEGQDAMPSFGPAVLGVKYAAGALVYRCKTRKPDGAIVDGCGWQGTNPTQCDEVSCGDYCPICGSEELRQVEPHVRGLATQIHGGPLVVEAHRSTQAGSPEDVDARQRVLRSATYRLAALRIHDGAAHSPAAADHVIHETIALLQSLLPASPSADAQAQVDMAAEHTAPVARSVFALIETVCKRGGRVEVGARDMLNPACGYEVKATWPDGSRYGASKRADSGMWEKGDDHTADPIEALARLAAKVLP